MKIGLDEELLYEKTIHEKFREIHEVMISDVEVLEYPLGEMTVHLISMKCHVTFCDCQLR